MASLRWNILRLRYRNRQRKISRGSAFTLRNSLLPAHQRFLFSLIRMSKKDDYLGGLFDERYHIS